MSDGVNNILLSMGFPGVVILGLVAALVYVFRRGEALEAKRREEMRADRDELIKLLERYHGGLTDTARTIDELAKAVEAGVSEDRATGPRRGRT